MKILFLFYGMMFFFNYSNANIKLKNTKIIGFIIYYRDSLISLGDDHKPNPYSFEYFFEEKLSDSYLSIFFKDSSTYKFKVIDKPWGGFLFINKEAERKLVRDYFESLGITYKSSYNTKVFDMSSIPKVLLESSRKFISVFKFEGYIIGGFTAQNNINKYYGSSFYIQKNKEFKLEYLFSVVK